MKLYGDVLSQPTRTVLIFCKLNNIPVEFCHIDLGKGQQRSAEYLQVNPLGKVPALEDGEFGLSESVAIMRYLLDTQPCAPHWYPNAADRKTRARIDSVLCWYFNNIRDSAMKLCWNRAIAPVRGLPTNEAVGDFAEILLRNALGDLEKVWLASETSGPFVCGLSQPTIADVLIACELEQLRLLDGAVKGPKMDAFVTPRVQAWMEAVRDATNPAYDEVHTILKRAQVRFAEQRARM